MKYKLMPEEPTTEMVEAGRAAIKNAPDLDGIVFENTAQSFEAYHAMWQAAPDGWISVKDRLPDHHGAVLVRVKCLSGSYADVDSYWFDLDNWSQNDAELGEIVTHWSPLPEPPKE